MKKIEEDVLVSQVADIKVLFERLNLLNNRYSQITQKILDEQKIKLSAINLISIIGEEKLSLKEITEASELDKSTISRQINTLVKEELVLKTTGKDRRFSFFELSKNAKIIYNKYKQDFIACLEDSLKGWLEEEKQMFSVLIHRANFSFQLS